MQSFVRSELIGNEDLLDALAPPPLPLYARYVPGGAGAAQHPGVRIDKRWNVNGLRASATYQVTLTDVRVPTANALRGNGLRLLEVGLNARRILIATYGLGIARRIRGTCMDHAQNKSIKGAPLATNVVFAAKIGQFEMQIEMMANARLAAAREYDAIAAAGRRCRLLESGYPALGTVD